MCVNCERIKFIAEMANHYCASIFRNSHTYQLTHSDVRCKVLCLHTIVSVKMASGERLPYTYNSLCILLRLLRNTSPQ